MNRKPWSWSSALCLGVMVSWAAYAKAPVELSLRIGDPAPPLQVMKWLKGGPVAQFERGHVYVIDFWATWCGPCIASMPHLSELARKYSGKVTFIGVDVRQADSASTDVVLVQKFVDKMGPKMDYIVAMDDPEKNTVFSAWSVAAGVRPIPTAFIVDGQGKLSWLGNPLSADFEPAIEQTLNGTIDLAASRASQQKLADGFYQTPAQLAETAGRRKLIHPVVAAYSQEDYAGAVHEADRIVEQDAGNEGAVFALKLLALLHTDVEAGFAYADSKQQDEAILKSLGLARDSQDYSSMIACIVARQDNFSERVYRQAADTLEKYVALHPGQTIQLQCLAQARSRLNEAEPATPIPRGPLTSPARQKSLP